MACIDDVDDVDFQCIEGTNKRKKVMNNNGSSEGNPSTKGLISDQPASDDLSLINEVLPDGYTYNILKLDVLKRSEVVGESHFHLECRVNIVNLSQWEEWLEKLSCKSGTSYNKSKADRVDMESKRRLAAGSRKCIHNVKSKPSKSSCEEKKRRSLQPGKDTNCAAMISFSLGGERHHQSKRFCPQNKDMAQEYPMFLRITYTHNHSINAADALRYRPISENVKKDLIDLFAAGHSPSSAYHRYLKDLAEQYGDDYSRVSADRTKVPDYFFVFHFHANYIKSQYGSINGVDSYLRAVEKIEAYNEKQGRSAASIGQTSDGEACVAICDDFMTRCHELLPQSGDIIIVCD